MDLDVLCRFVFVGWVFNGVCLVFGLVGWDSGMGCFALGWVVCINRAEFSGVVWSVLVGLGLL